jgi:hypothetical protein
LSEKWNVNVSVKRSGRTRNVLFRTHRGIPLRAPPRVRVGMSTNTGILVETARIKSGLVLDLGGRGRSLVQDHLDRDDASCRVLGKLGSA